MGNLPLTTMLFIGVNLDFFIVLLVLLQKFKFKDTLLGYEIGMLIVFCISATAGQVIQTFIPEWAIGILGLIPIYMGIKGEADDDDDNPKAKSRAGIISVLLIYLVSCGADNIAVYVPVLATMSLANILLTAVYFIILTVITLILAYLFGQLPIVKQIFIKWGEPLGRIIYVLIGIFVMFETGLISYVINLF